MTGTAAATAEGTRRYAERATGAGLPVAAFRPLGRTGLTTSALGFGTYRVDESTLDHAVALRRALDAGVNLIDTSTNYTDGSSERTIGSVLRGRARDEIIVVSKVGYVQGQALALSRKREAEGKPFPDMVKYMDGCWHCIHPEFLADQLTRSLDRLGVPRIDVYLLHNPEYFFSDAIKRRKGVPIETLRDEFYERVARAFAHLETEVARGRIGWYGVSSNSFGDGPEDPEATSVERVLEIAKQAATPHHFAAVQLPTNLYETGPILTRNNARETQSAIEFAAANDLAVLVNRPLNAYRQGRLVRLADAGPVAAPAPSVAAQAAAIAKLEAESPGKRVAWGKEVVAAARSVTTVADWIRIEGQIRAQLAGRIGDVGGGLSGDAVVGFDQWMARYLPALDSLLAAQRVEIGERGRKATQAIHAALDPHLPPEWRTESLSRKAIAVLVNTPGVTCVLNGMRRPAYVDDALGAVRRPAFTAQAGLFRALAR